MVEGEIRALRVLVGADGEGTVLRLDEPLSLWGGFDPSTGEIIDRRHPQSGVLAAGRVWCMDHGRGSSSASSILLEAVRLGNAPAAIVLKQEDGILALGAAVAQELYSSGPAILLLRASDFARVASAGRARVHSDGRLRFGPLEAS